MARVHGNMLRSPTRRQAGSRRQKVLGSPGRVAKIDKALAAGPDLSDEQVSEVKTLRDKGVLGTAAEIIWGATVKFVGAYCRAPRAFPCLN